MRDVVVIGGGHNGLVTAAYLARAGRKPLVLERRAIVGGAAVTEEFHPGFKAPTLAHAAGPLRASVVRDLGLRLETVEPEPRVVAPLRDGRCLQLFGDAARSAESIRLLSPKDAARWPEFHACLGRISAVIARVLEITPPDLNALNARDLWSGLGLGVGMLRLGREDGQHLLRWGPMAVADFVQEWFESDALQALIAARGITGMFAGPWSAGTTANLLLRDAMAGGNGAGSTVFVKGGLGVLSEAIAQAARAAGAEVRTGAEVAQVIVKDGRAAGVVLAGGETIDAKAVVSACDPRRTLLQFVDPSRLDPFDFQRMRNYRSKGMCAKVNLALDGLASFPALAGGGEAALRGRIHIGPDIDTLERAYDDAKHGDMSRRPYLDVTLPSLSDAALAPAGKHVMSIYVQYTPFTLKRGDWNARRDELGEVVLATLEEYAPGLSARVVGRQVVTPLDLERTYGLSGGHPSHGEPALDQIFSMRPLLGWARYRSPVKGLYMCSAGTHPGGGVTGGPGANAAREILRELK